MNESTVKDLAKFEERNVGEIIPAQPKHNSFLATVERLASNPDVDVAKIQQIVDMQKDLMALNAKQAYNAAMVRAQNKIPSITRTRNNKQTNSKYADLDDIMKVVKPIITEEGFAITFSEGFSTPEKPVPDKHIRMIADIMHQDGHTEVKEADISLDNAGIKGSKNKTDTHAKGSSFSYGRRYMTCMIFGISTGDDDDGNGAGSPSITEKQLSQIIDMIASTETDETKFLKFMKVKSLEAIPAKAFVRAMNALKAKARKNADNN